MRKTALDMVYELALRDPRILFIGSDLRVGTLKQFKERMPDRFFMEGVSEATIIGMAAGLALAWYSYSFQKGQALALQHEMAKGVAIQTADFVQVAQAQLRVFAQNIPSTGWTTEHSQRGLSRLVTQDPFFEEVSQLDQTGREVARASRTQVITADDLRERSYTAEFVGPMITGDSYIGSVWYDPSTGEPFMTVAVPISNPRTGGLSGVVAGTIRVKKVWGTTAIVVASDDERPVALEVWAAQSRHSP
jgi:hypothetical protein